MNSEVKALEWAVSALVAKLDMLLTCEAGITGLLDARHGLHIITPDHLKGVDDAFVTIHPIEWTDGSSIKARFYQTHSGWILYEGGIIENPNLLPGIDRLIFKPSEDPIGLRPEPTGEWQERIAMTGYAWLIATLQKDAVKF